MSILPGPEAVREVFEVRLEQRFDNDLRRCLYYTIGDDRDAERAFRAIRLRDINSPNRQGPIAPPQQLLSNTAQERVYADFLLDDLEGLLVVPGTPPLALTRAYATRRTSSRHTLSYSTPNLRVGFALAARYSDRCNTRTLTNGVF